jgi:hypothetical protein
MVQALLVSIALVALAGLLSSATGSRWPLAILMTALLGQGILRLNWRRDILRPYTHIRPVQLLAGLLALLTPVTAYVLTADLPVLGWSLLSVVGQEGGNIAAAGFQVEPWYVLPYGLLLLAALPHLALIEEYWFRRGTQGWRDGLLRSLLFGLAHMVVGVPVGVAVLGLAPVGLFFTAVYLRASRAPTTTDWTPAFFTERFSRLTAAEQRGIDASAGFHLAYNALAVTLAIGVLMVEMIGVI